MLKFSYFSIFIFLFTFQAFSDPLSSLNIGEKEAPCIAQCKVKLEKLNKDLSAFEQKLAVAFRNSVYLNDIRRFRMYSNGYKNHLNSCTKDNPKTDMSEIAAGYETFKKRLEQFNKALEEKESWAAEMEKTRYAIKELMSYYTQMPSSPITHIDLQDENKVTIMQWEMIQDYKEDEGAFYNNVILDSKNEIKRLEDYIDQTSTLTNFTATINNISNRTDKTDAKAELGKILLDLNYFKSIFYPENKQLDLFIQLVKAKL
ncbi:hypothetical protein DNU06_14095 [Putridiphycobacter roseus]|uniref:Uncharacterized protein n=1 Tax=Putridiphycobacter roseus TaxID=2219161 RepID=A0A2W1NDW3_9FLAO|nr:hypothetical protein [Putridiphycobacter roseus]PZE16256.1 hypothetical protein DNU06_14095 [Putridiphycobacter roseus]